MTLRTDNMTRTCQTCGNTFSLARTYYIDKRPARYCSLTCTHNKFGTNHTYFNPPLTPDKLITLGQFIATGFIQNDHTIIIRSDQSTIDDIQNKIGSRYPVEKSDQGKLKLKISSSQMVQDLGEYGMVHNPMYQEFIPYDILEGLLKTDCYEMKDGVHSFRTPSSKLALEVSRLVSGTVISETYKDVFRGVLGCDWVVVW
jgi:hypothetical protein